MACRRISLLLLPVCLLLVFGAGLASAPPARAEDATALPEQGARLTLLRAAAPRAVYGTPSRLVAAMVTAEGLPAQHQRVELLARRRTSTRWRLVAVGLTGTGGRVRLHATLPASSVLRLDHPVSGVAHGSVAAGSVTIAKRITARVGRTRTRVGMAVVIRGGVWPAQRAGTPVYLQRRVAGSWRRIAAGQMRAGGRYDIRWHPLRIGRYALRAVVPRYAARVAGATRGWWHRVNPEISADIATDILRNDRITLATVHLSAASDRASARRNIYDVATRRLARTSCHGGSPCRVTRLDRRVLRAVREMGTRGRVTVSELAGGVHAGSSAHYRGRAVDITWVNGRHVARGSRYAMVVAVCRAYGANQIFTPSTDPWGGHSRHVHCGWR